MKILYISLALSLFTTSVLAQDGGKASSWKPVLKNENNGKSEKTTTRRTYLPPPPLNPLSGRDRRLKPKEQRGVRFGREWANNADMPARGKDGSITFVFGATLPAIVCAPLHVCDLSLQPGEIVNDINIGDSARWKIKPAIQGAGNQSITHVMIKPTDIGLLTNLVITTDRRAYTIKLVSRRKDWMPRVSFYYPEEMEAEWSEYRTQQDRIQASRLNEQSQPSAAKLDFSYEISGDTPSWRPVRVYSNGVKTYIQFPREVRHGDLPALVALGDDGGLFSEPSKQLVNYRYVNGRFEVDKVLENAALISGVGWSQTTVRLRRHGDVR